MSFKADPVELGAGGARDDLIKATSTEFVEVSMSEEIQSGLLQDVRDLDAPAYNAAAADATDGTDGQKMPGKKKGDGDGTDATDGDGTDGTGDNDGTDGGDSDGTDGGDSDGTDGAGDSDGTDH
jgi:hypothetical protein